MLKRVLKQFKIIPSMGTTALITAFLQVNCSSQVSTTHDTTGMIKAFFTC